MNSTRRVVWVLAVIGVLAALQAGAVGESLMHFATAAGSGCIPFDPDGTQIPIHTQVNGRDSAWFTLDTGASSSVLDAAKATTLGLVSRQSVHSLGAGGVQEGGVVENVTVTLPGCELRVPYMDTLDLLPLSVQAGRAMDGILGHEVFAHSVVELDYEHGCVTIRDAEGFRYRGTGQSLPLAFHDNHPYVNARVVLPGGHALTGEFVLDTGSSGTLILAPDVVERENVIAKAGKTLLTKGHGVGGSVDVRFGRVEQLQLGRFTFTKPTATFQPPGAGQISVPGSLGNIGGGVLSRFKVIFDYERQRMILEPRANLAEPFEADMSGLALVTAPPEYQLVRVLRVRDDSPAAGAGIQVGDVVERVDGVAAADLGLPKLRKMLRIDGREVKLDLRRGTEPVQVTIRTRRMI